MKLTKQKIQEIQDGVLDWYAVNKRDLPWRRTQDPYAILVSEIMLQQTQVSRVIPKYEAFLQEFPTVEALATSSSAAVIRAWAGLGYNRRALNLQRAARLTVQQHGGQFPSTAVELMNLPGVGRYTAGAVATFAFAAIAPAVDTNVRQCLDVLIPSRNHRTEADYYDLAVRLIPTDRPGEWLHALMDYASLVIRKDRSTSPPPRERSRKRGPEPFIGSNRYLRGRVVERLRVRAESMNSLYRHVAVPVEVDRDRFIVQLTTLERDGMIERHRTRYRLPEE